MKLIIGENFIVKDYMGEYKVTFKRKDENTLVFYLTEFNKNLELILSNLNKGLSCEIAVSFKSAALKPSV